MGSKKRMSAHEINCLIYSYLQDSGFEHSSYALRNEARLDYFQHANAPLRRGELVSLLHKALLYTEVESHWNMDPSEHCDAPFSLLLPHKCSSDPTNPLPNPEASPYRSTRPELFPSTNGTTNPTSPTAQKRKASPMPLQEIRPEKRICVSEDVDMHLGSNIIPKILQGLIWPSPLISQNVEIEDLENSLSKNTGTLDSKDVSNVVTEPAISMADCPVVLLYGHEAEVFISEWNPVYPDLLATGSKDSTTRIWSWKNTREKVASSFPGASINFQLSHPDPMVLSHTKASGQLGPGQLDIISSLDWSPDGTLLATGSFDASLRVWNRNGEVYMIQTRHLGRIVSVKFSPCGKYLLSASLDGVACVWNMVSRILHIEFHNESECLDVDWLDDSTFVICSSNQMIKMVSIYPDDAFRTLIESDQVLRIFTGHTGEINQVKFNKDRSMLASCSDDSTARIWTREAWTNPDGSVITFSEPNNAFDAKVVLLGHSSSIGSIQWCPTKTECDSQNIVATCSFDKTARLWDANDGSCLRIMEDSSQPLFSITFDPTGHYLATGGEDGHLYIYDAETGETVQRWPTSDSDVGPIYYVNWQKHGGSYLAMCLKSNFVAIMDTSQLPELPDS